MKVNVALELSLSDAAHGYDGAPTILEEIVAAAARQVLDEDKAEIRRAALAGVREIAAAEGSKAAAELVAAPFQPFDRYGDPRGAPVTLRAFIADEIRAQLKLQPDRGHSPNAFTTVLRDEIRRAIDGELKAALDEARKQIGDELRAAALAALAKRIAPAGVAL